MDLLTAFGLFAVTAMVVCYALKGRRQWYVLGLANSCLLGSAYGFLQGAWPLGVGAAIWSIVAFRRFWSVWKIDPSKSLDFGQCGFCGQPLSSNDRQRTFSIDELVGILVRSGLATEQEAAEYLRRYRDEYLKTTRMPDTITAFCRFLVANDILTTWQCWKLRNGQWKGFYLDDFVIIDFQGKNHEFSYYLARDTRDDAIVVLEITPMNRAKGPETEYRVHHHF
jgi:hypothetical protein